MNAPTLSSSVPQLPPLDLLSRECLCRPVPRIICEILTPEATALGGGAVIGREGGGLTNRSSAPVGRGAESCPLSAQPGKRAGSRPPGRLFAPAPPPGLRSLMAAARPKTLIVWQHVDHTRVFLSWTGRDFLSLEQAPFWVWICRPCPSGFSSTPTYCGPAT